MTTISWLQTGGQTDNCRGNSAILHCAEHCTVLTSISKDLTNLLRMKND